VLALHRQREKKPNTKLLEIIMYDKWPFEERGGKPGIKMSGKLTVKSCIERRILGAGKTFFVLAGALEMRFQQHGN
jgi:hypothetical protein